MTIDYEFFHVDAFSKDVFGGNPAAVCVVPNWPEDHFLQQIAAENNLAETAFIKLSGAELEIRWFTPKVEVDLCGHGTLAAAFVVLEKLNRGGSEVKFRSKSGELTVTREANGLLIMDLPIRRGKKTECPERLIQALNIRPQETFLARDYMLVFDSEDQVRQLAPNFERLLQVEAFGVIATAPGNKSDFVSRFFAPRVGINEDPVTGSSHCTLIPFWAERLKKSELLARQISVRGGELHCSLTADHVRIGGFTALYSQGRLCF